MKQYLEIKPELFETTTDRELISKVKSLILTENIEIRSLFERLDKYKARLIILKCSNSKADIGYSLYYSFRSFDCIVYTYINELFKGYDYEKNLFEYFESLSDKVKCVCLEKNNHANVKNEFEERGYDTPFTGFSRDHLAQFKNERTYSLNQIKNLFETKNKIFEIVENIDSPTVVFKREKEIGKALENLNCQYIDFFLFMLQDESNIHVMRKYINSSVFDFTI